MRARLYTYAAGESGEIVHVRVYSLVFFIILHTRACVCVDMRFPTTPVEGKDRDALKLPCALSSGDSDKKKKRKKNLAIRRHARARVLDRARWDGKRNVF